MPFKLFLFLEGTDDVRFFTHILFPLFRHKYSNRIKPVKYAEMKPSSRERMITAIKKSGADFVYVQDLHSSKCVTASRQKIMLELNEVISEDDIAVVIKEIECWYLCGLNQNCCRKLTGKVLEDTHTFTKNRFNRLIPRGMPRSEFMLKILEKYDVKTGKINNASFKYFIEKWVS